MYRIVRCPHPLFVVIGAIHLYQDAVLGGYGIEITIAILAAVFLIAVEVGPRALHLAQFVLGCKVTGFPVAPQLCIPDEGAFLALAQAVDHLDNIFTKDILFLFVLTTGKGHGHSRHVVAGAVPFQFGGRRVPAVGLRVAVGRQPISIAIVIQLLFHGQADELVDVEVTVPRQAVIAVDAHHVKGQCLSHGDVRRHGPCSVHDLYRCRDRIAVRRRIVANDESAHLIRRSCGIDVGVGLGLLDGLPRVQPFHLPVFAAAVGIRHP